MHKKKLKSFLNIVNLNNGIIRKESIHKHAIFLDFNLINKVQNLLQSEKYITNLIYSKVQNDLLVSEWKYIEGTNLKNIKINNINELVSQICNLHKLPLKKDELSSWDFLKRYDDFKSIEYRTWVIEFNNKYKDGIKVFSHNDLHKNNILLTNDKKIQFIDWDFACLNDEYFDFASLIYENNITLNKIFQYILEQTNLDKNKLIEFIIYNCIYWLAWNNYMYKIYKNKTFLKYKYKTKLQLKYWIKHYTSVNKFDNSKLLD